MNAYNLDVIRRQIIGNDILFETPYGKRHLLYTDYTASGRGLSMIEDKIRNIEKSYANTHTEDDYSGKYLTTLLHQAETKIKELVNAGPKGKIIMTGSGTTGALKKLQEILGVYIPPVTKERIERAVSERCRPTNEILGALSESRPVVFIGPYEHHTNELMWREAFTEVVVIPFGRDGAIDLKRLDKELASPKYASRQKICSFSAGSNITGIRTRVYDIAQLGHAHNALVFFDFAAVAPYVEIDMNRDEDSYFDAIFFSPHKFLGGPGTSGILVFNEHIYRKDLPPTTAGGGTVLFVGFQAHDFAEDIETREKAGTPPILQGLKAALVLELKHKVGIETIEKIEAEHTEYFLSALAKIKNIELVGDVAADRRVSIVSFNIRHKDRILHPKFVTKLMNDLFGIQSRAGCSCAGPYGHILLDIDNTTSQKFRSLILKGCEGIKPGWVRVNVHYTHNRVDVDFLIKAIRFLAEKGHLFLKSYAFDMARAEWTHKDFAEKIPVFSVDSQFEPEKISLSAIPRLRESYFQQAEAITKKLEQEKDMPFAEDERDIEDMKSFYYIHRAAH
jgi:selenocysteine lyase/cysteine desulfurase